MRTGRIAQVLLAHGALRIASGANGVLIGLYLAGLRNAGGKQEAGMVGILSAVSFAAELFASIPMGLASDALSLRWLMTIGATVGAVAALLFGLTHSTSIFFASRTLEGLSAAAVVPALLAYLTVATEDNPTLRVKAMSFFELTLLAGLGLGGAWWRLNSFEHGAEGLSLLSARSTCSAPPLSSAVRSEHGGPLSHLPWLV